MRPGTRRARGGPRRQPRPPAPRRLAGGGLRGSGPRRRPPRGRPCADAEPARARAPARACSRSWPRPCSPRPSSCPPSCWPVTPDGRRRDWPTATRPLAGLFGLVLRYASHTPAASLALAALPLALTQTPDPRARPGPRAVPRPAVGARSALRSGRARARLRAHPVPCSPASRSPRSGGRGGRPRARACAPTSSLAALASAAVLSVAAAAVGPLPESLAGAVGVLALALDPVLLAGRVAAHRARRPVAAAPHRVLRAAAGRPASLGPVSARRPSSTRAAPPARALWNAMGARRARAHAHPGPRLARDQEKDLAYANWAGLARRPLRQRLRSDGPAAHARGPGRDGRRAARCRRRSSARSRRGCEMLGVRWVQVPATSLAAPRIGFARRSRGPAPGAGTARASSLFP